MGAEQRAIQESVDAAILCWMRTLADGRWHCVTWDDLTEAEQGAVSVLYGRGVVRIEDAEPGSSRYRLSSLGLPLANDPARLKEVLIEVTEANPECAWERRPENPDPEVPALSLPIVHRAASGDSVEWQGVRHPVSGNWADAFEAMLASDGAGIGLTNYVGHTRDAIAQLPTELKKLLDPLPGNKGYRLRKS